MPEIRQECAFEADEFVDAVTVYEDTRSKKTKEQASAKAIDFIRCMISKER